MWAVDSCICVRVRVCVCVCVCLYPCSGAGGQNKPVMLIIHKSYCGACKNLKALFRKEAEDAASAGGAEPGSVTALAESFAMLNLGDDDEPQDEIFRPDGGYIPRVLFVTPSGTVLSQVINEGGNPKYKYYYPTMDQLAASMAKVLDMDLDQAEIEAKEKLEL